MQYKNLTLIGTSHIAKQSIKEITDTYNDFNPDLVAIELDKERLFALIEKRKGKIKSSNSILNIFKIGVKGYIFSLIGEWVEKELGEHVGVSPGEDMLTAFKLAKKDKKQVALIDQQIQITLKKLSKAISWKEKWNFLVDIFKAVILRKKEVEGFDLSKVPNQKIINQMMDKVRIRYPNIFYVLVTERNKIMAKNLIKLIKQNPEKKILATIGAGHEKEILNIIKDKIDKIEIVYSNSFTVNQT